MGLLVRVFERDSVVKLLFILLLCSLLVLADAFVLYLAARLFGIFLVLAVEAGFSLIASFVVIDAMRHLIGRIRASVREGSYPLRLFRTAVGCLVGGILLVLPGFASSALGIVVSLPGIRYLAGRLMTGRSGVELSKVYEVLKLREFETVPGPCAGPGDPAQTGDPTYNEPDIPEADHG